MIFSLFFYEVVICYFFFSFFFLFFFFNDTATTEIYTLSLPRRSSDHRLGDAARRTGIVREHHERHVGVGRAQPSVRERLVDPQLGRWFSGGLISRLRLARRVRVRRGRRSRRLGHGRGRRLANHDCERDRHQEPFQADIAHGAPQQPPRSIHIQAPPQAIAHEKPLRPARIPAARSLLPHAFG